MILYLLNYSEHFRRWEKSTKRRNRALKYHPQSLTKVKVSKLNFAGPSGRAI